MRASGLVTDGVRFTRAGLFGGPIAEEEGYDYGPRFGGAPGSARYGVPPGGSRYSVDDYADLERGAFMPDVRPARPALPAPGTREQAATHHWHCHWRAPTALD